MGYEFQSPTQFNINWNSQSVQLQLFRHTGIVIKNHK